MLYGMYEAMVDFDTHYSEVSTERLGMRRLVSEPSVYVEDSSGVIVTKHVDDGMVVGTDRASDNFLQKLGEHFLLKISPVLRPGGPADPPGQDHHDAAGRLGVHDPVLPQDRGQSPGAHEGGWR